MNIYIYIYVRTRNIKNWFRGFKLRNAPLQSTKLVLKMKKEEKKKTTEALSDPLKGQTDEKLDFDG